MSRIKQRSEDFRVRELLREGVLGERGDWRVYRVVKRKLTSLEAASRLAELAGAAAGDVSMAGMKDRQGVTVQHMALPRGRDVSWKEPDLRIESVGFTHEALAPEMSEGNAFEIVVRGVEREELDLVRANMPLVRQHGLVNYFDDQRFGNLRHGQGWIALQLIRGEHEAALRALLAAPSPHDDRRTSAFKAGLQRCWGDWNACRDVAGRFQAHHSVFEHLKRQPDDFAGAFAHVSTRLRLIHLYAFQSHLWNRAVAAYLRERTPLGARVVVDSVEGPLVFPAAGFSPDPPAGPTFRLPGPRLEDVTDPVQRALLADALAAQRLVPADYDIAGVPGFQLKGEDRALFVLPRHLRVRPSEPDPLNRGLRLVKLRFELPRGSYATLVIKRLLARPVEQIEGREASRERRPTGSTWPRPRDQATRRDRPGQGRPHRDAPHRDAPRRDAPRRDAPRRDDRRPDAPRRDDAWRDRPRREDARRDAPRRDDRGGPAPRGNDARPGDSRGGRPPRPQDRTRGHDRRDRGGTEGPWTRR